MQHNTIERHVIRKGGDNLIVNLVTKINLTLHVRQKKISKEK